MGIEEPIKKEMNDVREIWGRFKRRDFSGNTGQAIKNSSYQFATNLISKIGSLFFMVVLARLIIPELFGLYSLTLSTILFFNIFSDLGVSTALLVFASKKLGTKNYQKAKDYYQYLLKYKLLLLLLSSLALLSSSYFVSEYYYNKPIFYALLAGALYIFFSGLSAFLNKIFLARNNFKMGLVKEVILQVSRLILVPLIILIFISRVSPPIILLLIFVALTLTYLISIIPLYVGLPRKEFKEIRARPLSRKEKRNLNKFIIPLSVTALSGTFFGSIDMIMLGHFVRSEFIGYYQASFGLITAASTLLAFSGVALFPIFSKLKGIKLERGLRKSVGITALMVVPAAILVFFIAPMVIRIIYGTRYLSATPILQIFSLLLLSIPFTAIYTTYYLSQKKTKVFTILIIISTLLNIVLNYFLINYGLQFGMMQAVIGACVATIISRYVYLLSLVVFRGKS